MATARLQTGGISFFVFLLTFVLIEGDLSNSSDPETPLSFVSVLRRFAGLASTNSSPK
jgi:hypothetical protein